MKRTLSILLACLLLCSVIPFSVFAADDAFRVVISLEGFTLGQGYYVEPTAYSVDQINALIKNDGYGPYTEDTLTAGMATLAMLNDKGLTCEISYGTWMSGGYLNTVNNIDKGKVNFPAVVTANGGPSNKNYVKNPDKNLDGSDYEPWSGWMTTVNDAIIGVSACDLILKDAANAYNNTYVIRWQFSLANENGLDMNRILGYPGWYGDAPYFPHANKDNAMIAYTESSNARAKMNAKTTLEKLDATQAEVDATIEPLGKAETVWDRIVMFFVGILNAFQRLFQIG